MKRIAILGSTGSIGVNSLRVISALKGRFNVVGLSADTNIALLSEQARLYRPKIVSVRDESLASQARRAVGSRTKVVCGVEGLAEIASRADVDMVVCAIGGSNCLVPLLAAIEKRKEIALANKESLVSGGSLVMRLARKNGVAILPIDSEHSAIFQCIEGRRSAVSRIYLTGSGGPLLKVSRSRFDRLSRADMLNHPKWRMGRKISIDSATMMNKGLEIIEAHWLFGIDVSRIEVLIHPEAIIHSMVEMVDGAVFAHMGMPDMRMPIQYALTYPGRYPAGLEKVDFPKIGKLTFLKPDLRKFPCLELARISMAKGGTYPAVLSAADEAAVHLYLSGAIKFTAIPRIIEKVLARHISRRREPSIDDILSAEVWAKEEVERLCH